MKRLFVHLLNLFYYNRVQRFRLLHRYHRSGAEMLRAANDRSQYGS